MDFGVGMGSLGTCDWNTGGMVDGLLAVLPTSLLLLAVTGCVVAGETTELFVAFEAFERAVVMLVVNF